MYITILGRQPALGVAELERKYGGNNVAAVNDHTATVDTELLNLEHLGGTLKAGRIIAEIDSTDWTTVSKKITQYYAETWAEVSGKITLGISAYGFNISEREVQKTGIVLKGRLKGRDGSLRLIPNTEPSLSTATSHHNKLGLSDNKVEILIVKSKKDKTYLAESIGSQNITAYAKRDQERPKRDAFVGMLPPKLAQIIVNLAVGEKAEPPKVVLDPFCGTGVILQEAALMNYSVYGTDLSEKMIRYSRDNLNWLEETHRKQIDWYLHEGDATNTKWRTPLDAIACESYLGQPFSAPPSPAKLIEVQENCNRIITSFLKNIGSQVEPGTPLCVAVPAWRNKDGQFAHLPLIENVGKLGYKRHEFRNVSQNDLLYYREDQVVARELLVLVKS
jgi:tRNA G10  N-methylase Trm11